MRLSALRLPFYLEAKLSSVPKASDAIASRERNRLRRRARVDSRRETHEQRQKEIIGLAALYSSAGRRRSIVPSAPRRMRRRRGATATGSAAVALVSGAAMPARRAAAAASRCNVRTRSRPAIAQHRDAAPRATAASVAAADGGAAARGCAGHVRGRSRRRHQGLHRRHAARAVAARSWKPCTARAASNTCRESGKGTHPPPR